MLDVSLWRCRGKHVNTKCILCLAKLLFRSSFVFFSPPSFCQWYLASKDDGCGHKLSWAFHSFSDSVWTRSWETCWNSIIWKKSMGQNMSSSITIEVFWVLFGVYPRYLSSAKKIIITFQNLRNSYQISEKQSCKFF